MKKLYKLTLVTILIVISTDQIMGLYMSSLYEKNYYDHANGDVNKLLKGNTADTVIIGSSRVYTMINPKIIGKNISLVSKPSKHSYYNIAIVDLMNQHKKMPKKMLIFNIEVEDVYESVKPKLINDVCYLKYYYYSNDFIRGIINQKASFEKFKYIFSSYRFNGENFTLVTNSFQNIHNTSSNVFTPLDKSPNDNERLRKGIEEMKALKLTELNPDFLIKMNHLIEICKKNSVKLVLLYGPNYFMPKKFKEARSIIAEFCLKNELEFLDFSNENQKRFKDKDLWFDHIHLNKIGAEKYSLLLKKELSALTKKSGN